MSFFDAANRHRNSDGSLCSPIPSRAALLTNPVSSSRRETTRYCGFSLIWWTILSSATLKKEFVKNHCIMQLALKKTLAQNAAKINNRLKKVLNYKTATVFNYFRIRELARRDLKAEVSLLHNADAISMPIFVL